MTPRRFELALSPQHRTFLSALILVFVGIGAVWSIQNLRLEGHDFYTNLWGPSHLITQGKSPYNLDPLYDEKRAVWFPMAIGLFFPFGWLSQSQAINVWFLCNLGMIAGIIFVISHPKRPSPVLFGLAMVAMLVFPPMVGHLKLGQFTLLMTLLMLVLVQHMARLPILGASLILVLILTKPQLAILTLPGFLLAYMRLHHAPQTLRLLGVMFGWGIVLCIPLFVASTQWPQDFFRQLQDNPDWKQPSTSDLLTAEFGQMGFLMWGGLASLGFGVNLWGWWKLPARDAVVWSLAFTPLITPYVWSWDFVLLLPLLIQCFFQCSRSFARIVLIIGYIAGWIGMVRVVSNPNFSDDRYWWVTWYCLGVILVAYTIHARLRDESQPFFQF